ncbi:MAG: heparan-alpha-glucosaminide N-acetyltransferase domain-containing protein [Ornithinimicrobium sp.]
MTPGPRSRIVGIDVARALALLGMVSAHMIDQTSSNGTEVDAWFQLVAGRSAALFAVLAGVSIVLTTRATGTSAGEVALRPGARRAVAVRAALIAAIGLVLGIPDVGVAVILVYYGALFCCAIPFLRWQARSLLILSICCALASPVASLLLRTILPPPGLVVPEPSSLLDPLGLLTEVLVTGYYPVLTWVTYLFVGMAVGRLDLRSKAVAQRMVLLGLSLAIAALGVSAILKRSPGVQASLIDSYDITGTVSTFGELNRQITLGFFGITPVDSWWWLGIWAPHSGSIADLAHTAGCAVTVLGAALLITHRLSPPTWRAVHIAAGAGTMTLTLYAVHILLLGAPEFLSWTEDVGFQIVVLGSLGALFAATHSKGPLELAVSRTQRLFSREDPLRDPFDLLQ